MDFSWLSSGRGNFAWLFSTITESYKPELTFDEMSIKLCSAGSVSTSDVK